MIAAYTSLLVALLIRASAMFRVTALGRKKFISGESPNTYPNRGRDGMEGVRRSVSALNAVNPYTTALIM